MLRDLLGDGLDVVQLPHEVIAVDQLTVDVVPSAAAAMVRGRASASAPSAAHLFAIHNSRRERSHGRRTRTHF